jgi:hypothetical protein
MSTAFDRRAWLCFALCALAATAWRPFTLGFLTDDWSVLVDPQDWTPAFSAARWHALEIAQNRPVLRVVFYVLTSVVPATPFAWHATGALLNVAAGFAVAIFARDVLATALGRGEPATAGGLFAGACWIAFPFSAATQFWATGTTAMPAVAAFAISGSLLLRAWNGSRGLLLAGAAISLLGYLVYEAHYFQIAPLLVFAALLLGWRGSNGAFATVVYGGALAAAIAFGRIMRMLGAEGSRGINANFVDTFFHWYLYVGRFLGLAPWTVYAAVAAATLLAGAILWALLRRNGPGLDIWRCMIVAALAVSTSAVVATLPLAMLEGLLPIALGLGLLALCAAQARIDWRGAGGVVALVLAGICLGALPFAIGNYVVFSLGFGARATLGASLWLALGLGLVAALAWRNEGGIRRAALGLSLVWAGLTASDYLRGREWARPADLLTAVFVDPPLFPFGQPAQDAHFLLSAPELPGRVPVIEVNHHVFAIARRAFAAQARDAASLAEIRSWDGRWLVARDLVWNTVWNGVQIVQRECRTGELAAETPATSLWLWDHAARTIAPVSPPYVSGCALRSE